MRERFYRELMAKLGDFPQEYLERVSQALTEQLDKYDISVSETALVEYDGIANIVKLYLVSRKIEGMAMSSLNLYKLRLEMFCNWCTKKMEDVTANDIRLFLYKIKNERDMSDRTLEGVRTILAAFFKWATAEGYIQSDPTANIKAIKFAQTERGHLTESEINRLRDACETRRDLALVEVFYSTGCRVSEVVNMKVSDIKGNEIVVVGKGNKERKVYLNASSRKAVSEYLMTRGSTCPYLFVSEKQDTRLGKDGIEKRIAQLGELANIGRRVYPHLIRHSTATIMLSRGSNVTDIQKLLGHSNLNTTMIYADVLDESVKEAHAKCIV